MERVIRSIIFGQIFLYIGLLVCVIIRPNGLGTNDGISYYGTVLATLAPYSIGLLGGAFFAVFAGKAIREPYLQPVRLALFIYAPLVAGIVITPVTAGRWIDYLHTTLGTVLFLLQLALSIWLVWRLRHLWWSLLLCIIELVAGILSAIYVAPPQGFLLQGQIIFQLAFGMLLVFGLQRPELNTSQAKR